MRMTDLGYILYQQTTKTRAIVHSRRMLSLEVPSWDEPTFINALISDMAELWHRIESNRKAASLLQDSMITVIEKNPTHGAHIKAEYSAEKPCRFLICSSMWNRVVNGIISGDHTTVVPVSVKPVDHERKPASGVRKTNAMQTSPVEPIIHQSLR